ncbi:fimbria/pilus periplasmic chaperone [Acinetobacter puyangensis]|uniref:Fimbrial chaperone protein n=1 Tax=Acinetobacter puyangensis TaxID=1096779 RepID=A0A240EBD2_9GAMM|nr:molecular chaperone [Acinetobacter puyangensis]SNX46004.1 fimbrial chaperone protein [Acinetobacter puyangensis]
MKNMPNLSHFRNIFAIGMLASTLFVAQAHAASLQVAPILLEFSPQEKVKELWLTNTGNDSIRAQVRVNAWTQTNHQDVLTTSKDLIASPMVLTIPAGQRQLVRLIRNIPTTNTSEQAYRLIVDELPDPQNTAQSGLQLLLKYSIPVFFTVSTTGDSEQGITSLKEMKFSYTASKLMATNHSNHYKRFSQLSYIDAQGKKTPIQMGLVGYVLSGQTMQWDIPKQINVGAGGQFVAVVNMDVNAQSLPLSP